MFMLPLAALPLPSSASPIRPFVHPAFATISFGPQSPSTPAAGAKPNTPFQSPPLLPHIASTPTTQGMRQQQQQSQKQQKQQQQQQSLPSRGNLRTPTMSELRQGANAEHVRTYGLTDDVDESDGRDLSLKSDQRPQVSFVEPNTRRPPSAGAVENHLQRYLSDVEGQRLEKAGDDGGIEAFAEDGAFDGDGGGEEDIDREMLMSQLGPSASRPASAYRTADDAGVQQKQRLEYFNSTTSPSLTPVLGGGSRERPLTPMTLGLVKHILKTSEGTLGGDEQVAAGTSVQSLVQKKTKLLHEEEAMLAQYMNTQPVSSADSALQALAKARMKEIGKQLRVLATWNRTHSSEQLTMPDEISFSRPSSAYRSILSHVSAAPPAELPADFLRLGTPGIMSNFGGNFGAMALENNGQVQHSWPAVATVVMTPWGAALSPLPPLAFSADSQQQQHNQQEQHQQHAKLQSPSHQQIPTSTDQSMGSAEKQMLVQQQQQLQQQQQMLETLINQQQQFESHMRTQPSQHQQYNQHDEQSLYPDHHQQQQNQHRQQEHKSQHEEEHASQLVIERVHRLEESARQMQGVTHQGSSSLKQQRTSNHTGSRVSSLRTSSRSLAATMDQSSKKATIAPTRECNQGVMVGNGIYRDERGMRRNGGPQVHLIWDAAVAICRHLDAVPHLVRLSQTCIFFKRVCQLTPSLWQTVDLTSVGSFEEVMRSRYETHMTTANVSTLLTQRCTDGDMLEFRASSVQAVTDELMPLLAKKGHNLLELDVGWHNDTGPAVTDAGVILVLKHAQQLQIFKTAWVASLTDASLLALSTYCRFVTHVDVSGVPGVTDVGFTSLCESNTGPQLLIVSVYGCERLTDSSLMRMARRCTSLVDVNVGGCSRMSGDAVVLLCSSCRDLANLNASGLFRLNDLHVFLASRKMLQLQSLTLAFCRNIGADSISALAGNHPPFALEPGRISDRGNEALFTTVKRPDYTMLGEEVYAQFKMEPLLSHLDLRGNDTLNDPLLSRLADNLLNLHSIDIRGCSNVTRNAAQALGSRLGDRWQTAKANAVLFDF